MGTPGNRYIRHTRPRTQAPTRTAPPQRQRGKLIAAMIALALLALLTLFGAWLALAGSAQAAPLVGAHGASVACTPTSQSGTQPSPSPATTASSQGIGGNTSETPCSASTASSTPSTQHTASATPCTTTSPGTLPTATATQGPQTKPTPNPTNTPIRFPTAFPTIAPPKGPTHTNGQIVGLLRNQYKAEVTGCGQAAPTAPTAFNSDNIIYLLMITTAVLLIVMFGAFLMTLSRRPRIQPASQR